jgi:Tfp pilus assembly protein PilX
MKQAYTRRREQGSSLLFSAMLLLIGSVMAGGMLALTSANFRMANYEIETSKVHYIAEAGIYRAIARLQADGERADGEETARFGEGEYRVQILSERENHPVANIGKTTDRPTGEPSKFEPSMDGEVKTKVIRLRAEGRLPSGARSVIVTWFDRDSQTFIDWQEGSAENR